MISLVKRKLDDDIDDLFRLPVAEFTNARNALAARLKKEGRANDAEPPRRIRSVNRNR
jgi:hypothetical protein